MRRAAPLVLIALAVILSIAAWPRLPDTMAIHWGISGRPDGWAPKAFGAFVIPGFQLLLLLILRAVMPTRAANASAEAAAVRAVELTIAFIIGFMTLVHAAMLGAALGWAVDVVQIVVLGVSGLFVGIGTQLASIPRNPWYGYRTPRTLRSDHVWVRTHRVAGPVMVIGGLVMGLTTLLRPDLALWAILGSIFFIGVVPLVYSMTIRE
jgi:uncharacterized membrane protein